MTDARTIYRDIVGRAELERLYSPSSCVSDLPAILKEYGARSTAARAALRHETHAYGEHPDEVLDLFDAPAGPAAPAMVYIHGGYWQELGKGDHSFPAPGLHRQGIRYAAVNYGLAPRATMAEMVDRCRRALAWLMREAPRLGIDENNIHLSGCSAGAHLAAMVALAPLPRPLKSLTLMSGIFDLRPIPLTYVNDAIGMTADEALCFSPLFRLDTTAVDIPPTFVCWADNETPEFKRQSRDYSAALTLRGAPVWVREFVGRNHFDLIFDMADETTAFGRAVSALIKDG